MKVIRHGHAISVREGDDRALTIAEWIWNERLDLKAVDAAEVARLRVLEDDERHAVPPSRDSVTEFYHGIVTRACFAGAYSGGE